MVTDIDYNAKGQRFAEIDAEGYLTEKVFDKAGNVTQSVRYATALSAATTPGPPPFVRIARRSP